MERLFDRPQCAVAKLLSAVEVSSEVRTTTGAPQGRVLSPALFKLHTSDCRCAAKDILQVNFSDDTSLTGLNTTSENSHRCAVENLVGWCNDSHLLLNVSKTNEILMDLKRDSPTPRPLAIIEEESSDRGGIQVPGLHHRRQIRLVPERPGPLAEGQPAALLHGEAEIFQRLFQAAGTVLQVHGGDIQQLLSLDQPQRRGQGGAVQVHQDSQQSD